MKQKNRYIAYLLIVVSIIMLAASVFPHHHHWDEFCLLQCDNKACHGSGDCNDERHDFCHDSSHSHHHGLNDSNSDCKHDCVTYFSFQLPQGNNDLLPYGLPMAFLYFVFDFNLPETIVFNPLDVYQEHLHSVLWVIHGGGLRAPPCFL